MEETGCLGRRRLVVWWREVRSLEQGICEEEEAVISKRSRRRRQFVSRTCFVKIKVFKNFSEFFL